MAKEPFATELTTLWIGGFFFWIIKGFRGKLIEQYEKEYEKRNICTGYFITLIAIGYIVYFLVKK